MARFGEKAVFGNRLLVATKSQQQQQQQQQCFCGSPWREGSFRGACGCGWRDVPGNGKSQQCHVGVAVAHFGEKAVVRSRVFAGGK